MAIALDHDSGMAVYQNMFEKIPDPVDYQEELLNTLQQLGGLPRIITNKKTAQLISPVAEKLNLDVIVLDRLPLVSEFMDQMHHYML
ncbi:hypothetical protein P5G51_019070 [Virgibacillus sp. 179-BFC.A HS]|uniref:DUF6930 domain-containing protein n=1 Tax=Tigheibacillus jepli TaxID=3035914 RepID=A0ABU5CLP1_9BACI|nr:hypothetical protein [Virgibacillus sp. 179-BFC.A HS]MDY0407150.1 hypothetical protein [Virgibacillus sp. 179-BFC.A HS]